MAIGIGCDIALKAIVIGPVNVWCPADSHIIGYLPIPAGGTVTYASAVPISTATVTHLVKALLYPSYKKGASPSPSVQLISQGYAWATSAIVVPAKWEGRIMVPPNHEYLIEFAIYDKGGAVREFALFAIVEVNE